LKGIGEIEDEDFDDGIASGQSSKQLILGSESDMPFNKQFSDASPFPGSPASAKMTKE